MRYAADPAGILHRGVDEHEARHLVRVGVGVEPDHVAAEGVADERDRAIDRRSVEQLMQIARGLDTPRRIRAMVAPSDVGAVVPAGARERGDAALDGRPDVAGRGAAADEHDGRLAAADAMDVEGASTDVDRAADLCQDAVVAPRRDMFVDRRRADSRYDPDLPNMTDLDFLMGLYRTAATEMYLGTPLHDYVKISSSMSNASGFTERMIHSKTLLLARLESGFYPMADPAAKRINPKITAISKLDAIQRYNAEPQPVLFEPAREIYRTNSPSPQSVPQASTAA